MHAPCFLLSFRLSLVTSKLTIFSLFSPILTNAHSLSPTSSTGTLSSSPIEGLTRTALTNETTPEPDVEFDNRGGALGLHFGNHENSSFPALPTEGSGRGGAIQSPPSPSTLMRRMSLQGADKDSLPSGQFNIPGNGLSSIPEQVKSTFSAPNLNRRNSIRNAKRRSLSDVSKSGTPALPPRQSLNELRIRRPSAHQSSGKTQSEGSSRQGMESNDLFGNEARQWVGLTING